MLCSRTSSHRLARLHPSSAEQTHGGAEVAGRQAHDRQRKVAVVVEQRGEHRPVDGDHLRLADGDRGSVARFLVDQRRLAENLSRPHHVDGAIVGAQLDAAALDDIGAVAALTPDEDDPAVGKSDRLALARLDDVFVESGVLLGTVLPAFR